MAHLHTQMTDLHALSDGFAAGYLAYGLGLEAMWHGGHPTPMVECGKVALLGHAGEDFGSGAPIAAYSPQLRMGVALAMTSARLDGSPSGMNCSRPYDQNAYVVGIVKVHVGPHAAASLCERDACRHQARARSLSPPSPLGRAAQRCTRRGGLAPRVRSAAIVLIAAASLKLRRRAVVRLARRPRHGLRRAPPPRSCQLALVRIVAVHQLARPEFARGSPCDVGRAERHVLAPRRRRRRRARRGALPRVMHACGRRAVLAARTAGQVVLRAEAS